MNTSHQHAPHVAPARTAPNAALLIDFDNVTMGIRSDLQTHLRRLLDTDLLKGKVAVQRAYADWRRYPQYIAPLSETSIDLIFAPASGSSKKNATDIRLAIDALELVFTRPEIGTFILLSGDSDFFSLVIKLKEYGKYVIGVGIRDSASDLLVQNCHEYYGYSELTGLTPAKDQVTKRRDPWELVVEAVVRMQASNDIMRSDRLKQVMQDIDPHFDEKDAGVSKFSRFVSEAEGKGLLLVKKLENGQLEVAVGPDANVPVPAENTSEEPSPAKPPPPRRRSAGPDVAKVEGMPLGDAFGLLKRSMEMIGALDAEATDAQQVRELMMQLSHSDQDPLFEQSRFEKFLRQASDASAVEIVKSGDNRLLKLNPDADVFADPAASPRPVTKRKRAGTRAGGRGRGRVGGAVDGESETATDKNSVTVPAASSAAAEVPTAPVQVVASTETRPGEEKVVEPTSEKTGPAEVSEKPTRRRGVGARGGSRSRRPAVKRNAVEKPESPVAEKQEETKAQVAPERQSEVTAKTADDSDVPSKRPARKRSSRGRSPRRETSEGETSPAEVSKDAATTKKPESKRTEAKPKAKIDPPKQDPPEDTGSSGSPAAAEVADGGLFQRVSSAVQRALGGNDE